jgi:hypothetical protein
MAKKDSSKKKNAKKDKAPAGAVEAVEAVRNAVERTFAATAKEAQSLRGPAQEFAGDLANAANRIREVLESRVLEELKGLRSDVEGLSKRVSALEGSGAATASKPAARKPAARRTSAGRGTASKRASSSTRASASKPASSTSRSSASKPAASRRSTTTRRSTSSTRRGGTTRGGGTSGS